MHNPNGARGGRGCAEREVTHWNLSHQLYKVTRGPGKEGRVSSPRVCRGRTPATAWDYSGRVRDEGRWSWLGQHRAGTVILAEVVQTDSVGRCRCGLRERAEGGRQSSLGNSAASSPPPPQCGCFLILSPHPELSSGRPPGPVFPLRPTSLPAPTPGFLFGRSTSALLLDDLGMVTITGPAPHLGSLASPRWFLGLGHKASSLPLLTSQSHKPGRK